MSIINVLLADDHQLVLDGFNSLLKDEEDIHVVASVNNGREAVKFIRKNKVDVAVLDIEMPELDGIQAAKKIKAVNKEVKILILSMYNEAEFIKKLIEYGVSGYILKNKGYEELVAAIRGVHQGEEFFGKEITKTLVSEHRKPSRIINGGIGSLTKREVQIFRLIGEGYSTPQITELLDISYNTVSTHRRNIIDKLNVSGTKDLIRYASKHDFGNTE